VFPSPMFVRFQQDASMTEITGLAILAIFPICMLFATFYDIFTMTIPNKITLVLLASYAILAPLAGLGLETILWSIGLAFVVLVVGFGLFSLGVMGGGDAKLLAASTLWFGTALAGKYILYASLLGGVLTIAILLMRSSMLPRSLLKIDWVMRIYDKKQGVPYGAALGPAALIVFADTPWRFDQFSRRWKAKRFRLPSLSAIH